MNHILIVEAYEGFIEYLSDELDERKSMQGLGLPVEEIAERLDCRITVLCWDSWYRYELKETRATTPATRPVLQPDFGNQSTVFTSSRVRRVPIPTIDPVYRTPFAKDGLSPRSYGLINDSGLFFFASYCLEKELRSFYRKEPFQAAIFPLWGGLGYVSQMARATGVPSAIDVPYAVVATDKSVNRQMANQEGVWTRHAAIRRQMEDVSLALADLALVFGPRGKDIADAGRLPEALPPVCAPRHVEDSVLDKIAQASVLSSDTQKLLQFFLYEPQQAASGALTTLDSVALLARKGVRLNKPVICSGPPMSFAPMKPRGFEDYWSSRGFVRELVNERQWKWEREYPPLKQVYPVRLYPSYFEYLPNVWGELARGSLALLSPAAAEGLAPDEVLPREVLIQGEPVPEHVADCLEKTVKADMKTLDEIRRKVCKQIIAAHRGAGRGRRLDETVNALKLLLQSPPEPQDLSRVSLMFFDRCVPLRNLALQDKPPSQPALRPETRKGALTVVVACYEMGAMITEAVKSVWNADRQPEEVLLVDDGSRGDETLTNIRELENYALEKGLPLKVIRQRNQGLASARNAGLAVAKGEFISFLDGDDIIEPPYYQIGLRVLEKYPRLGGVAAWASIFGTDIPDGFWNAPQPEFPFLFIENSIIVPCLTRTELLRAIGGYDIRQRYNYEDWELGIRMLVTGWPIVTIPMHLTRYRVRNDSLYRSMTDVQNQVMRELLMNSHRETVCKFAVEIAMQLENQWKKQAYSAATESILPAESRNRDVSFRKSYRKAIKRILQHFSAKGKGASLV
ncbi:MAG: hypothetical protein HW406_24 [Candidatus Brocadiaceae bacterium]|nr:hypothetical protein [Candidatus Brocadiaceae bacterium]